MAASYSQQTKIPAQTRSMTNSANGSNNNKNSSNQSAKNFFKTNNQNGKSGKPSGELSNSDLLAAIMARFDTLSQEIADEVEKQLSDLKPFVKSIVKEELENYHQDWLTEKAELTKRLDYLEMREEARLRFEKRDNIVIHNLEVSPNEPKNAARQFLKHNMDLDIDLKEATQMTTANRKKLVLCKLRSWEDKKLVMQSKDKLKNSSFYITHDRTKKQRVSQNMINEMGKEEESKGRQVKVGYLKLTVDGTTKFWREGKGFSSQGSWSLQSGSRRSQDFQGPRFHSPDE